MLEIVSKKQVTILLDAPEFRMRMLASKKQVTILRDAPEFHMRMLALAIANKLEEVPILHKRLCQTKLLNYLISINSRPVSGNL